MNEAIAIVGAGCRYPDADDPDRLWETVLARRRAFRPIPRARLSLDDYLDPGGTDPDRTYTGTAAVLEGWTFDRARFRVPGPAHRVTDPAHWLALEVAADTLTDAGFPDGSGLDRDRVAVVIGNTMAGEVSRASLMRLRWPYVRRTVAAALGEEGWDGAAQERLLARLEGAYKAPFPEPNDESLAGGLANTIAGRICNHFDLHGGGHTVDGACASSLLAVINGCAALLAGDADLVLAGGVDLSLDPFELVGFARTGALAAGAMRVYDAAPTGFWPGEGCGMVALMRARDAAATGRTPLALIRGWGMSSDGGGGITRPEAAGQLLALRRAYDRAGFGPESIGLFEGHGTGTAVGDRAEIEALMLAHERARVLPPAALGTVKANIGHTKAAAGVAGLIKAALALRHRVIPPTTGCAAPHPLLTEPGAPLRIVEEAEPWPDAPARAAVSAMGFGGINTHLVLEAGEPVRTRARIAARRPLDHEVFVVAADHPGELRARLERIAVRAEAMSAAEHIDLAAALARTADGGHRVAIVAAGGRELAHRARQAAGPGVFTGSGAARPVGLLFTGQGAPVPADPGALAAVYASTSELFDEVPSGEGTATAQPAITRASLAGLRWLERLGVQAAGAAGHSLGEISALHWAGALGEREALLLATARGAMMAEAGAAGTGMASISADPDMVAKLLDGTGLVIAADNGIAQVVAGDLADLERVLARARAEGLAARRLAVSHAFHSPALAAAAPLLAGFLARTPVSAIDRPVYSTVTGTRLAADEDVRALLTRQVTAPVLFRQAVSALAERCGLLVEVGPGGGLAALAEAATGVPAVTLDVGAGSAEALCSATAALFAAGAIQDVGAMFAERFHRPFDLWRDPVFLGNPCESAPELPSRPREPVAETPPGGPGGSVASVVRRLLAEALELPREAIGDADRLLGDLHLNSLRVAQLAARAAGECGREAPAAPLSLSEATVGDVITVIEALPEAGRADHDAPVPGVADWHRVLVGEPVPIEPAASEGPRSWRVSGGGPLRELIEPTLRPGGEGLLVFFMDDGVEVLVAAAREAVIRRLPLVIVDPGDTASGFAGTLRAEHPGLQVRYVRAAGSGPAVAETVRRLLETPFDDVTVDDSGGAATATYRPVALAGKEDFPFGPADLVLITGGGKGIGLESARALARHGVRLVLLGRSDPDRDPRLAADLTRLRESGAEVRYVAADVTDPEAVRHTLAGLGPVAAVIHASGVNQPARFADLDAAAYAAHAGPKVDGLRAVLAAIDVSALRALVTYGSVIGRFGLPGEAHYALANGRMRELARRLGERLPGCWVCNVDWTAWSGAGMGQRLDVLDGLVRSGVVPLPAERGAGLLIRLLATRPAVPTVLATGRLPALDKASGGRRVYTPGVELVTETELDLADDTWLSDHRIGGAAVLPAVATVEAMTAAAQALTGRAPGGLAGLRWEQPVTLPDSGTRTLRVCALAREDGAVDLVVRSDETGFAVDHASGRAVAGRADPLELPAQRVLLPEHDGARLYGSLFFHGPAFRRLRAYERLEADGCIAILRGSRTGGLVIDDATIHVLQGCVPHRRLLPVGGDRFTRHPHDAEGGDLVVRAVEREHRGADYTYDVAVTDLLDRPILSWHGLRLRDVGPLDHPEGLPPVLAGPYLHRGVTALLPEAGLRLRVEAGPAARTAGRGTQARPAQVRPARESRSHLDGLVLVVVASGDGAVACDWEEIGAPLDQLNPWAGVADELARLTGESRTHVLTRLWTVQECLSKAGRGAPGPLTVAGGYEGGWVLMRAGADAVASCVLTLAGRARPVAVAVLAGGGDR